MNIFQHYLWFFGIRFHLWTFLVLGAQLLYMLYRHWKISLDGVVVSVLSVTFSIHFYETIHGFFSWKAVGVVGASLWKFNIPVILGLPIMLYFYNKKHDIIHPVFLYLIASLVYLLGSMMQLFYSGFFSSLEHNFVWGLSKLCASVFVVSLFGDRHTG